MNSRLNNAGIDLSEQYNKGLQLLQKPGLFQHRNSYVSKGLIELKDQNFNRFECALGTVKTYKSTSLRKDRDSGEVFTEINSVNITKSSGKNYLSLKKLSLIHI